MMTGWFAYEIGLLEEHLPSSGVDDCAESQSLCAATFRIRSPASQRTPYRRGRLPLMGVPVRAATIRDDRVLCFRNHLRGRYRWSTVVIGPSEGGPADILRHFGRPILSAVVTGYRGVMVDDLRAPGFLPHRSDPQSGGDPSGGSEPSASP